MQLDTHFNDTGASVAATHDSPGQAPVNILEARGQSWRWTGAREGFHGQAAAADSQGRNAVRRLHDLEINPVNRTVTRGGRVIALTPHEFSLLQFLIAHQGQIVTRAQIRENLYKHNQHRSNVIDAHICYLRNKIDKGFDLPLILTRWREGYLFRAEERPTPAAAEPERAEVYW